MEAAEEPPSSSTGFHMDEKLKGLVDWENWRVADAAAEDTSISDNAITDAIGGLETLVVSLQEVLARKLESVTVTGPNLNDQKRVDELKKLIHKQRDTQPTEGVDDKSIKEAISGEGYCRVFAEIEAQEEIKRFLNEKKGGDSSEASSEGNDGSVPDAAEENSVAQLSDRILENWYRQFFGSLQLPELVSRVAMKSRILSDANMEFCPLEVLQKTPEETLIRFWREAAPELAKMTKKALNGQSGYDEQQAQAGKMNEKLELGELDAFYTGLDGVIGLPKLKVLEAMEEEHRSAEEFESHNQGRLIKSSPKIEWERVLPAGKDGAISTWDFDKQVTLCEDFMTHRRVQDAGLTKPEVIALRLYSSPMYVKYNGSLRALLGASGDCGDSSGDSGDSGDGGQAGTQSFVTTIHAIASALIKLSKISPHSGKKYRGLHSRAIPECFLRPNSTGGRGGVEYGFLSTSTSKEEAIVYATSTRDGLAMPVL